MRFRIRVRVRVRVRVTCEQVGAQDPQSRAAFEGLAGSFEGAGATAQEKGERPGLWL